MMYGSMLPRVPRTDAHWEMRKRFEWHYYHPTPKRFLDKMGQVQLVGHSGKWEAWVYSEVTTHDTVEEAKAHVEARVVERALAR